MKTDVLIVGAGLAGLSTAWHLARLGAGLSWLVVEKEARPGGTAGSVERDGFVFDHTGHLLHLHDPAGRRLVAGLLAGNLARHRRRAWVWSNGTATRYPFQANTYGLPWPVVEDCVAGFLKTVHRPAPAPEGASFEAWCLAAFGEGIARRFMLPYNEKLWRRRLSCLTTGWQGRFVPRPSAADVLAGGLTDQRTGFGYNAEFHYPVRGGSQALCDSLAGRVRSLRLRARLALADLDEKVAVVEGLGEVRYRALVNTMPLPFFLDAAGSLPAAVREASARLRWTTVLDLNLGVARPGVTDKHWLYFPERRFPFYRVGCQSNFSRFVAPRGASSLYVEAARSPAELESGGGHGGGRGRRGARNGGGAGSGQGRVPAGVSQAYLDRLERSCLEGLRSCGLLRPSDRLLARLWLPIHCGYAVYDRARGPALAAIFRHLRSRGVESIGRWGAWKYSFMEEALLDGRDCARRLARRLEAR